MTYPTICGEGREHHGDILREIAQLVEAGRLTPLLDTRCFELGSALAAHQGLSPAAQGKVVVNVAAG